MGGCVGSHHDSSGSLNENSDGTGVALGRNQPLKRERPKWKSDYPMTEGQLRSKRDEFWDTAPAFEGRKEIWDALRAAASAFESGDHMLAQAILDGASITLPHEASFKSHLDRGCRIRVGHTGTRRRDWWVPPRPWTHGQSGIHRGQEEGIWGPDGVLRRAGEPLPAARLLPLPPRQHDRGALRRARRLRPGLGRGRPVGRDPGPGRGAPPQTASLHGPRPAAGGALGRHSGGHEAPPAGGGGRGAGRPALVLLRAAPDGPPAAGPAQRVPGLCGAGDHQPAPRAGHAPARTRTGGGGGAVHGAGGPPPHRQPR
uniref:Ubiquitin domain containing 2 n=1 Tax=Gadus morhua TaxID=8049 RepID=A0A8C5FVN8_GADMO